jgi:hypothetical protein
MRGIASEVRWILGVCGFVHSLLACGGISASSGGSETNTNFLKSCTGDTQCGGIMACRCGICTVEANSECDSHALCFLPDRVDTQLDHTDASELADAIASVDMEAVAVPEADPFGYCGDGTTDAERGEACDTIVDTAECVAATCRLTACGDEILSRIAGEHCETAVDTDRCNGPSSGAAGCKVAVCGDGYANSAAGEQCDDSSWPSRECDFDCTLPECGDGYVNSAAGEQCDDTALPTAQCDGDCTLPECGDGYHNAPAGEACDDGQDNGDHAIGACNSDCSGWVTELIQGPSRPLTIDSGIASFPPGDAG